MTTFSECRDHVRFKFWVLHQPWGWGNLGWWKLSREIKVSILLLFGWLNFCAENMKKNICCPFPCETVGLLGKGYKCHKFGVIESWLLEIRIWFLMVSSSCRGEILDILTNDGESCCHTRNVESTFSTSNIVCGKSYLGKCCKFGNCGKAHFL